jgi:phosphoribosylformylglycinamidine cyclo-ligase
MRDERSPEPVTYAASGVDIDAQDRALERVKLLARSTFTRGVLSDIGLFGGLFSLEPDDPDGTVLVASADGVGTKLKVAQAAGVHDTVGEDLVNHCVNDILVCGARPLFFLDYFACGALDPDVAASVVAGLARGCRANGCALLGGETAEMPGFYRPGEYDVAGFIVGGCRRSMLLRRERVAEGDALVALPSSGLHTNGYSLARRILFDVLGLGIGDRIPGMDRTVAEALLEVHRSYLAAVAPLLDRGVVKAAAHITGGGLPDNLPRVLPDGLGAEISVDSWQEPVLFRILRDAGNVPEEDMRRTFNLGVGVVLIVTPEACAEVLHDLAPHGPAWVLGRVSSGSGVRFLGERRV